MGTYLGGGGGGLIVFTEGRDKRFSFELHFTRSVHEMNYRHDPRNFNDYYVLVVLEIALAEDKILFLL